MLEKGQAYKDWNMWLVLPMSAHMRSQASSNWSISLVYTVVVTYTNTYVQWVPESRQAYPVPEREDIMSFWVSD